MERLSFDDETRYDGLEASIHMARYLLASAHCNGRRVLDVACGEGYGSRLLKDWGATEVYGVDVSQEAISHAQQHFGGEGIQFHCSAAENLPQLLAGQRFDLIVSLETIEHLQNPEIFLADLRQLLNPGGCIIISCPNDWWYFPTEEESNPYHRRKYHFEEFRQQAEQFLGPASAWLLGAPTFGFLNTIRNSCPEADTNAGQMSMMQGRSLGGVQMVPAEFEAGPKDGNASYFVGMWGCDPESISGTASLLPLSMDAFKKGIFQGHFSAYQEKLQLQLQHSEANLRALRAQLAAEEQRGWDLETEHQNLDLLGQAALGKNRLMQDTIQQLHGQLESAEKIQHDLHAQLEIEEQRRLVLEREQRNLGLRQQATLGENRLMQETIYQLRTHLLEAEQHQRDLGSQLETAEQHQRDLASQLETAEQHQRDLALRLASAEQTTAALQVGHNRYVRLRNYVPAPLRRFAIRARNQFRRVSR